MHNPDGTGSSGKKSRKRRPAKYTVREGHVLRHKGMEIVIARAKGRGRRNRVEIIDTEKTPE